MLDYSMGMDETFVLGYKKKKNKIIVRLANRRKFEVFNSTENEEKLLKKMEQQLLIKPHKIEDEKYEILDKTIVGLSPYLFINSPLSIFVYSHWGNNFVYKTWLGVVIVQSGVIGVSALCYYVLKYLKKDLNKNILFYENKDDINSFIRENPTCLDEFNKKTRKEITDRIIDGEEPINLNTVNLLKLKEIKLTLEKVKFYKRLDIESVTDVIEKEKTDLIKKYTDKNVLILSDNNQYN